MEPQRPAFGHNFNKNEAPSRAAHTFEPPPRTQSAPLGDPVQAIYKPALRFVSPTKEFHPQAQLAGFTAGAAILPTNQQQRPPPSTAHFVVDAPSFVPKQRSPPPAAAGNLSISFSQLQAIKSQSPPAVQAQTPKPAPADVAKPMSPAQSQPKPMADAKPVVPKAVSLVQAQAPAPKQDVKPRPGEDSLKPAPVDAKQRKAPSPQERKQNETDLAAAAEAKEKEQQEKERQEKERQEKERQEKERQEKERHEKERQEKERQKEMEKELLRQQSEKEQQEKEKQERLQKEKEEQERQEQERREKDRQKHQRLQKKKEEQEREQKDREEKERLEKEEHKEKERLERDREEKERLEKEEHKEKERLEREKEVVEAASEKEKEPVEKGRLSPQLPDKEKEKKPKRERKRSVSVHEGSPNGQKKGKNEAGPGAAAATKSSVFKDDKRQRKKKAAAKKAEEEEEQAETTTPETSPQPEITQPVEKQEKEKEKEEEKEKEKEEKKEEQEEEDWEKIDDTAIHAVPTPAPTPTLPPVSASPGIPSGITSPRTPQGVQRIVLPPGFWSPENPTGSKAYPRDFLLQFQHLCGDKPVNFNSAAFEGLMIEPRTHTGTTANYYDKRRDIVRSNRPHGMNSPRQSQFRARPQPPPAPVRRPVPQLNEEERLSQKVTSTLNKLAAENFEFLSVDLAKLTAANQKQLVGIIDQIFVKALKEPRWSAMYANLCVVLSENLHMTFEVTPEGEKPAEPHTDAKLFRRLLAFKCQKQFEDCKWKEARKTAAEQDPATLTPTQLEERALKELDAKTLFTGNISFVGELFKAKILPDKIINTCIIFLIKEATEEDMEALCLLLKVVGKILDQGDARDYMNRYMLQIKRILSAQRLQPRTSFLLQDILELRATNWVSRHAAAQQSKVFELKPGQQPSASPALRSASPLLGGRGSAPNRGVTPPPQGVTVLKVQAGRKASVPSIVVPPQVHGGRRASMQEGLGGRTGVPPAKPSMRQSLNPATLNLRPQKATPEQPPRMHANPSPGTSPAAAAVAGGASATPSPSPALAVVDRSPSVSPPPAAVAPSPAIMGGGLSAEEMEKVEGSVKVTLEELMGSGDMSEAGECLKEIHTKFSCDFSLPVYYALKWLLLQAKDVRQATKRVADLLRSETEDGLLSREQFVHGLACLMQEMEDVLPDAPNAFQSLTFIVARSLNDGLVKFEQLPELLRPVVGMQTSAMKCSHGFAAEFFGQLLKCLIDLSGLQYVQRQLKKSNVDPFAFFDPPVDDDALVTFLQSKQAADVLPRLVYATEFVKLVKQKTPAELDDWVRSAVPADLKADSAFGEHLFTAVLRHALAPLATVTSEATAAVETALAPYLSLLRRGACSDEAEQAAPEAALAQVASELSLPQNVSSEVFTFLVSHSILPKDASPETSPREGPEGGN
eukprot:TRINITY_DN1885_c0_g1_i3.p1 TRINITY_DN1885_c0_g1~~TRINITY_DN1885_c0_g1_i3.p1  ORF type:complete len:1577 (-),score=556.72 TRINITY_DN1885_c0_g1_i3:242-4501(-)